MLERAGLLDRRVDGRVHRFRLQTGPLREAQEWIARHRDFWNDTLDRLGDALDELECGERGEAKDA